MKVGVALVAGIAFIAGVAGLARLRAENDRLTARVAELERASEARLSDEDMAPTPSNEPRSKAVDTFKARAEKAEARAEELKALNAELNQKINSRPSGDEAKKEAIARKKKGADNLSEDDRARLAEAKRVFGAVEVEKETQRRYGAFLSTLNAPNAEEARGTLSELLASSKWGGVDFDERVRDSMAAVLSPEELEAFNRYEDELPEAMMRQEYDQDIALLAPELGIESRNLVVDMLVGDLLYAMNAGAEGDDYGRLTLMIESMYGTRDSLVELLSADELSAATRYLDIRISLLESKLPFVEAPAGGNPKVAASKTANGH